MLSRSYSSAYVTMNARAIVDKATDLGVTDPKRVAVGGHSYGAFSTVNAMVHTPFFKAGIAGDGAYNRTLTPNGFANGVFLPFWPVWLLSRGLNAVDIGIIFACTSAARVFTVPLVAQIADRR